MENQIRKFYEFGKFRFDAQRLRLEYDGEAIHLQPKSLETLKVLLELRGETVTREQIIEKVWGESFVEDANLTVAVSALRKTLSVYENETFIQTMPRKGYRFVAVAEEKTDVAEPQPIAVERHAVERLTIERIPAQPGAKKTRTTRLLLFALLGLIVATGAFAFWQGGVGKAFNSSNNAVSEAFTKGDGLLQKRLVCESIPHFREAIAKDENFARPYSGLAAALAMCSDPDNEADRVIARALALDPNLAEAHATDGFIKLFVHWDWDGAEAALRRAVTLDPNSAKAHHWLAVCLSIRGRLLEAEGEMRRAIEIEPDSPLYHADLCQIYYFTINLGKALSECQKAFELDPNFLFTPQYLRDIYMLAGDEQKAWEYEAKYLLIRQNPPESIKAHEEIFRREGFKGLYKDSVRFFSEHLKNGNVDAKNRLDYTLNLADCYVLLRDRENALYWLEQSFEGEKRAFPFKVAYLGVEPRYAFLRDDPRFQAILRKMNLKTN